MVAGTLSVNDQCDFDTYGNIFGFTGAPSTELLYSGEVTDRITVRRYLRARYYDPATSRFNRLDPFAGNTSDPQSLHKYLYANANPVMGIDPTGNMTLKELAISVSIISFLFATYLYTIKHTPVVTMPRAGQPMTRVSEIVAYDIMGDAIFDQTTFDTLSSGTTFRHVYDKQLSSFAILAEIRQLEGWDMFFFSGHKTTVPFTPNELATAIQASAAYGGPPAVLVTGVCATDYSSDAHAAGAPVAISFSTSVRVETIKKLNEIIIRMRYDAHRGDTLRDVLEELYDNIEAGDSIGISGITVNGVQLSGAPADGFGLEAEDLKRPVD